MGRMWPLETADSREVNFRKRSFRPRRQARVVAGVVGSWARAEVSDPRLPRIRGLSGSGASCCEGRPVPATAAHTTD